MGGASWYGGWHPCLVLRRSVVQTKDVAQSLVISHHEGLFLVGFGRGRGCARGRSMTKNLVVVVVVV